MSARFGWLAAAALTLALAAPLVRAQPLHIDEPNILEFAPRPLPTLLRDIFVQRGGAPLQFLVEHFTLRWPGGVEGLRLPSLVFAVFAVVLSGIWGSRLVGLEESVALAFALASAPLAVDLATFGRMYALFLFAVLAASTLSLRAGMTNLRRDWLLAGVAAGALVYVHPIAPLYVPFVLAGAVAVTERSLRMLLPGLRVALVAAGVTAAPYVWALAVLTRRYDVGTGSALGATGDRSVLEESGLGLTPGGGMLAVVVGAFAAVGLVSLYRARPRVAILLASWVIVPIVFFSVIPANTRFFVRYVVATLPPLLLLVVAGVFALGRLVGRPVAVGFVVIAILVAVGISENVSHVRSEQAVGVERLVVLTAIPQALLFSSTGSPIADRPAEHLDTYLALRRPDMHRLEELPSINPPFDPTVTERGRAAVSTYLRTAPKAARGVWIFRGPAHRVARAERLVAQIAGIESARASRTLLVVTSASPQAPRDLVEQAVRVRQAWSIGSRSDRWTDALIALDRAALAESGGHQRSSP